jgi:integrase
VTSPVEPDLLCTRFRGNCGFVADTADPLTSGEELSVGDYLRQWLVHVAGRVRPKTLDGYRGLIRLYASPGLGNMRLLELKPLDVQRLYSELLGRGLSAGTVVNLHLVLIQALGQAERWGFIPRNPVASAQPPRPRRPEPTIVDPEIAERLLVTSADTRFHLPVAIAISTGMRRGEILALRWADLDADLSVARVRRTLQTAGGTLQFVEPKTRRSRRAVELPAFVRPVLEQERADQLARKTSDPSWNNLDLVITRRDGTPVNPDTLSSGWYRFCRKQGLPHVRFHDLRHAHATLMLLQGVHPKIVSERLGHASIGITLDTYSHVLPSMQSEAVRAFDALFPAKEESGSGAEERGDRLRRRPSSSRLQARAENPST